MLPIHLMTSGDAQHTLAVYDWITANLPEIRKQAETTFENEVTAQEAQEAFHQSYTSLQCTRFIPLTVEMFTDEDTLAVGEVREPNVLLLRPLLDQRRTWVVVDHLHTTDLGEVAKRLGIGGDERTWRKSGK